LVPPLQSPLLGGIFLSRRESKLLALLFVVAFSATGEEARRFGERESAPPSEAAMPADPGLASLATPLPPQQQNEPPRTRYTAPEPGDEPKPIVRGGPRADRGLPPTAGLEPSHTPLPVAGMPETATVTIGEQPTPAPLPSGLAPEAQNVTVAPTSSLPRDLSDLHLERWLNRTGQSTPTTAALVVTASPSPVATRVPPIESGRSDSAYQAPVTGSY